ncbi:hypothetical protein ACWKWU_05125 [Chitinophaga lutea]
MSVSIDHITVFWRWFGVNAPYLSPDNPDESVLASLDEKVADMGTFNWELGPGKEKPYLFTISPAGAPDQLPVTKQIISLAPELEDWEFYYAIQPKDWDYYFEYELLNGGFIGIDVSGWTYVLLEYNDSMFDILVKAPELMALPEADRNIAAEIALNCTIGEALRLERIAKLEVVGDFETEFIPHASSITVLETHLGDLM